MWHLLFVRFRGNFLIGCALFVLAMVTVGCGRSEEMSVINYDEEVDAGKQTTQQAKQAGDEFGKVVQLTDAYLSANKPPTISVQDLYQKVVVEKDPGIVVLSVRKPEDYAVGHVPGAINIPFGQIYREDLLAKLPKDKQIVVVCYTGHTASQTAMLLNQLGYNAVAMKYGMSGWTTDEKVLAIKGFAKALEYPTETGLNEGQANHELPVVATGKSDGKDIILAQVEKVSKSGQAPTISAEDVMNKVIKGKDDSYFLLSIRKPEHDKLGHVPGAITVPFNQLAKEQNLKKLPKDKKIVVICYTGHTASYATMFLNQLGYEAYAMKFGMMGWTSDAKILGIAATIDPPNYPVETGAAKTK